MGSRHVTRSRSAVFAPLGDPSRATRVEQRLADAIRSGLLADGERLPSEAELAAMLGVATVTAREALVSLRAQGLVTTTRGRGGGSFVTRPRHVDAQEVRQRLAGMSRVELRDRGTLYRVVLAGCAELAAHYADEADVASLHELVVPADVDDAAVWHRSGAEMHLALAALTQSARMTREVARLEADFGVLLRMPLADPVFRALTRARHLDLVVAIGQGDGDEARRAVHALVDGALEHLAEAHSAVRG